MPTVFRLCLAFLVCLVTAPLQAQSDDLMNRLAGWAEQDPGLAILTIKENTEEITGEVKQLSEDQVLSRIREGNQMIADIRASMDSKKWFLFDRTDEEKAQLLLDGIKGLRDYYQALADNAPDLRLHLNRYAARIEVYAAELKLNVVPAQQDEVLRIKQEMDTLESQTGLSPQKRTILTRSLTTRLKNALDRVALAEKFHSDYVTLVPALHEVESQIDLILFAVGETAKVYDSAYQSLSLHKQIHEAYLSIEQLSTLESLAGEMMASWGDLDAILGSLTQHSELMTSQSVDPMLDVQQAE